MAAPAVDVGGCQEEDSHGTPETSAGAASSEIATPVEHTESTPAPAAAPAESAPAASETEAICPYLRGTIMLEPASGTLGELELN